MNDTISFRPAVADDVPLILRFIRELATYEKLAHEVVATEAGLRETLFGACAFAEVLLALAGETPAGFCIFFHNYSTFVGRPGIYIEDIYVKPEFRRKGIARQFFAKIGDIARERKCGRVEWWALDWNTPAADFYRTLGAQPMSEWTVWRLSGEQLAQ